MHIFHSWSNWKYYVEKTYIPGYSVAIPIEQQLQKRHCFKCNKTQVLRINP